MLRLDELERRLDDLEFREAGDANGLPIGGEALLGLAAAKSEAQNRKLGIGQAAVNGDGREQRFGRRSLTGSKIKREGLKAGTPAPAFSLPRLGRTWSDQRSLADQASEGWSVTADQGGLLRLIKLFWKTHTRGWRLRP